MTEIRLVDPQIAVNGQTASNSPPPVSETVDRLAETENWYSEPFTKRTGCKTPGQCGENCECGCPYNSLTEIERLPLIEEIGAIFPNEWLAFIISPEEDEDYEPLHGKLVAHSPNPDEVYDAVNAVLWNQHIYIFFNGDFEAMQVSYGDSLHSPTPAIEQRTYSGPKPVEATNDLPDPESLPDDLTDLIYSAVDKLYGTPNLNEAIRRLRLARVRAAAANSPLIALLDGALEQIEAPLPRLNEVVWYLEEGLAHLNVS